MRDKLLIVVIAAGIASAASADPAADSAQPRTIASPEPSAAPVADSKPTPIAQPISPTVVSGADRTANMINCRENQAATGSRLGTSRECHTKKEWDDRRADNQRTIENAQQIGLTGNPPGN